MKPSTWSHPCLKRAEWPLRVRTSHTYHLCNYWKSQKWKRGPARGKLNPEIKVIFLLSPGDEACFEESVFLTELFVSLILLRELVSVFILFCFIFKPLSKLLALQLGIKRSKNILNESICLLSNEPNSSDKRKKSWSLLVDCQFFIEWSHEFKLHRGTTGDSSGVNCTVRFQWPLPKLVLFRGFYLKDPGKGHRVKSPCLQMTLSFWVGRKAKVTDTKK